MTDGVEVDLCLWGKSRGLDAAYPLICHSLDAGAAAGVLWDLYLSAGIRRFLAWQLGVEERHARMLVVFWAGLHDIGKAMSCFQRQDPAVFAVGAPQYPDAGGGRLGHDYAAHVWLASALGELGFGRRAARTVAQMLGGHHGCFFELDTRASADPLATVPELGDGEWERQRRVMVSMVHRIAGSPQPVRAIGQDAAALVCGLVVLADWLVSQIEFLRARVAIVPAHGDLESLQAYFDATAGDIPAVLAGAGLGRLRLAPGSFAEEHGFAPNGLQRSVEENLVALIGPRAGLMLVTAPMGYGKTETALTGARILGTAAGTPGVFFGLPTMATADHIYARLSQYGNRRAVGTAALALLHSMAWLNSAYQPDLTAGDGVSTGDDAAGADGGHPGAVAVSEWLVGAKRGVLAPWATGTIDQSLITVVQGRHNMLRLLGLAGKVFVVDEVHAYDAYMQQLLCRLLCWLGRLNVPVVLLSATLPRRVAQRLVESYLRGAGHQLDGGFAFEYPGWLYADAGTGAITPFTVECPSAALQVDMRSYSLGSDTSRARTMVLRELLSDLVNTGEGCAGIICNTVAEAQQTFSDLRAWFTEITGSGGAVPQLRLLHSRFPADRRAEITDAVVAAYGKNGTRPWGVVVATQVIEQSIDLDLDLIISDLAPLALLLQRAGRGHRHPNNRRPAWATKPRLDVLVPVDTRGGLVIPRSWPFVYPVSLLRRTHRLLTDRAGAPIGIPDDVQEVMEQVYDDAFADGEMTTEDIESMADEQVKRALADMVTIPAPSDLLDLHALTNRDLDDTLFSTRLGAESGRVVCCYTDDTGNRWLDRDHTTALPERGGGPKGRFTTEQVKAVLGRSIPVPAAWVADRTEENQPPPSWDTNPHLRAITLLTMTAGENKARLGSRICMLDNELGLTG
ncbi:CRISPR-associated helicase Cas3' [Nocardia amamiensis]|uniref:CRISPR-associated helicase Cas3' n=1 Tax=Nocardia amamiensis TaxID=404578 RepID=UPI0033DF091B